ncbi:uncharacterized protein LOC119388114 [Rhipicephalus sanguineus]|uniref:uncharacterized protein LOC119388114 n=1 Tax=Rhipicephalus sanguineus TaxID=34632 RepID=UPI0018959736|nr:uncharacterized protein LOC119388114 [Rhipicephalus sanguineus]XP_049267663.1 uncharacterized protein LOC119388114 [Rhipicephalus sanguineus]
MNASAYACTPCGKTFTGPEPYNQHIASEKHKKKIKNGPVPPSGLVCGPCRMSFSGPAPMRDHMASAGHAKVMEMHRALTGQASTVETKTIRLADSSANKSSYLQCQVCNIPSFSCSKDAFDHYESAEHLACKQALEKGIEPSNDRPATVIHSALPNAQIAEPLPTLPLSVLVCRAEESFEDFCRRNNLSFLL